MAATAAPAEADAPAGTSNVGTQLVGCQRFVRRNPLSDRFPMLKFHSVEFWTGEATMTAKRCVWSDCEGGGSQDSAARAAEPSR